MANTTFDQIISKCKETNNIHIKHISGGKGFSIAADDSDFNLVEWDLIIDKTGILLISCKNQSNARFFPTSAILEISSKKAI